MLFDSYWSSFTLSWATFSGNSDVMSHQLSLVSITLDRNVVFRFSPLSMLRFNLL